MKKLMLTAIFAAVIISIHGQKVTFCSEGFSNGVKAHIGLDLTDDVLQTQTDTITAIDLSGLEIEEISDVIYLPNVTWIDLSENAIEDVSPLASLEHLRYVNLKRNSIESINPLVFACTDELQINVAENYIGEYTYLFSTSTCHFILQGMGAQKVKDVPYWEVNMFYADYENNNPILLCRGVSNVSDHSYVVYNDSRISCTMDGNTQIMNLSETPIETTVVTITNGEQSEMTYLVPPAEFKVGIGKTATLETGLPEDYQLSSVRTLSGTAEIEGNTIKYTAPANAVSDIVSFSYYQGSTLKGFSRFYVNRPKKGDVNGDGKIDSTDLRLLVDYIMGKDPTGIDLNAVDINQDTKVNVADVTEIVKIIKNNSSGSIDGDMHNDVEPDDPIVGDPLDI